MADLNNSEQALKRVYDVLQPIVEQNKAKPVDHETIVASAKQVMDMTIELMRETAKVNELMPTLPSSLVLSPTSDSTDNFSNEDQHRDYLAESITTTPGHQRRHLSAENSATMDYSPSPTPRRKRFDLGNRISSMPISLDVGDRDLTSSPLSEIKEDSASGTYDAYEAKEQQRLLEERLYQAEVKLVDAESKFTKEKENLQSHLIRLENELEDERKYLVDAQNDLKSQKTSNAELQKACDALEDRLRNQNQKDTEILHLEQQLNDKKQQMSKLEQQNRQLQRGLSDKESKEWSWNKTMEDLNIMLQNNEKKLSEESTRRKELSSLVLTIAENLTRLQEDQRHGRQPHGIDMMLMQISESLESLRASQEPDKTTSLVSSPTYFVNPANWTGDIWTILDEYLLRNGMKIAVIDQIEEPKASPTITDFPSQQHTLQSVSTVSSGVPNLFDELAQVGDNVRDSIHSQASKSRIHSTTESISSQLDLPGSFISPDAPIKTGWPDGSALVHIYESTNDRLKNAIQNFNVRQELQSLYEKTRDTFEELPSYCPGDKDEYLKILWMLLRVLLYSMLILLLSNLLWTMTQPYSEVGAFGFGGPDIDNFITRGIARMILWGGPSQVIWT